MIDNRHATRPAANATRPGNGTDSPNGGPAWESHEHTAEITHSQAQQLIESAGTAELAKHAVDVAAHQAVDEAGEAKTGVARSDDETPSTDAQARLAQMLGYASYLDLMESSKSAGSSRQRNWLVTADVDGHWALWNDADLEVVARFESHQEAVEAAATAIPKANPKAKLTPKSPSQSADL